MCGYSCCSFLLPIVASRPLHRSSIRRPLLMQSRSLTALPNTGLRASVALVPHVEPHEVVVHLARREERVVARRPARLRVDPRRERRVELEERRRCPSTSRQYQRESRRLQNRQSTRRKATHIRGCSRRRPRRSRRGSSSARPSRARRSCSCRTARRPLYGCVCVRPATRDDAMKRKRCVYAMGECMR